VVRLDGAVETSIQLGVADVVADVVDTGSTLRQAGLEIFGETVLESEAVLITRSGDVPAGFEIFRRRIEGVLVARAYVMMDYDIEEERVAAAVALTPGIEGPTIAPLHREGWVAVRAMVPRDGAQRLMDELYEIGARGILLTDIHACRL
jgi:ATP phosphoribosyltransferase